MGSPRRSRSVGSTEPAPSERVVHAVAEREGTEPDALEPPLYSAIDPDALDALVPAKPGTELRLSFTYLGHRIVVDGDGTISIQD